MEYLTKKQQKEIKANLQNWYEDALWYGYANTILGKLTTWNIRQLANEYRIQLEYSCPP